MGNEITAIAPSQILPIESYFSSDDTVSDIEVLSSTRFFKTVRGIHRGGGEAVVKVLVKYDLPDHYTKMYHTILSDLQEKLQSVPNSLPYFATWVSMIGTPDCQLMASAGYSVARKLTRLPISSDNMSATICMICLVQGQHCALWRRSGLSTSCCCL
jgi:hypothetical protein